ncbi:MAG: hypothetical protein HOQ32_00825 [Lysobacter sp.]|nr:hypothetical protein [Lysobacter sp.]
MRRTLATIGFALAAASGLAACGALHYKPLAPDKGTATLNMVRGAAALGGKSLQVYAGYRDAQCTATPGTGRLAWMLTYATVEKSAKVDAGQRLYLAAGLHRYHGFGKDTCLNVVSFTPQPQHNYRVVQESESERCSLRVVDEANGQVPPDLKPENPKACSIAVAD